MVRLLPLEESIKCHFIVELWNRSFQRMPPAHYGGSCGYHGSYGYYGESCDWKLRRRLKSFLLLPTRLRLPWSMYAPPFWSSFSLWCYSWGHGASFTAASLTFAPCFVHTIYATFSFASFHLCAPCLMHTPHCIAMLVHSSLLHFFLFREVFFFRFWQWSRQNAHLGFSPSRWLA